MDGAALLAALAGGGNGAPGRDRREATPGEGENKQQEWVQFNGVLDSFPLRGPEVRHGQIILVYLLQYT